MPVGKRALVGNFDVVYDRLAAKYALVRKQIPFVGSKYARIKSGDVIIELEAPHMSFTMT